MAHDLRFALRMIFSHRWFSAAVVATLALGIGMNTMVFTLVYAVLFKPVPVPGGARLVSIIGRNLAMNDRYLPMSYPEFQDCRSQTSSFEALEGVIDEEAVLSENGDPPQPYHLQRASSGIFSMLHTDAVLGRGFVPSDDKPGAAPALVIGYGVWKDRYSGAPTVIGRQVRVNGQSATIVGVMPKGFRFPNGVDLWLPLVPLPDLMKRENRRVQLYGILKPAVSVLQTSDEFYCIATGIGRHSPP